MIYLISLQYDDEDSTNTYTITGAITSVEHHTRFLTFDVGDIDCYYMLKDIGWDDDEVAYNSYKRLEQSGKTVTAIISEDWNWDPAMWEYNLNVIGVEDEEGNCFSVESHNKRQRFERIFLSFFPALVIVIKFISQIKIAYREIIIPTRKRRKRKKRELERQRLLEEHPEGIPPKQSKELSRAKNGKNKKNKKRGN